MKNTYWYLLLVLGGTLLLFQAPTDPDFGWHYRYGEQISKTSKAPSQNTFSFTMPDYAWADSYWMSEWVMYQTYSRLGAVGAGLLFSGIFATVGVLLLKHSTRSLVSTFVTALFVFIVISTYLIPVRPLLFSSIFMLILLYILLYQKRFIWMTIPLFWLWANMHADFLLGLLVLGVYWIGEFMKFISRCSLSWLRDGVSHFRVSKCFAAQNSRLNFVQNSFEIPRHCASNAQFAKLLLIFLGSAAVTLVNPYGLFLWTTLLKEGNVTQFLHISEWLPVTSPSFFDFALLTFPAAVCLFAACYGYKKFGAWYVVLAVTFMFLFVRSRYFLRILLLISSYGIGSLVAAKIAEFRAAQLPHVKSALNRTRPFFIAAVFLVIVSAFVTKLANEKGYPYDAVQYIKAHTLNGNMFNNYGWGGFLIWKLPEYKTFIDGRMPSWRSGELSIFKDYIAITKTPEKNAALFEKYVKDYGIRWVLDKPDSKLVAFLKEQAVPQWVVEYEDTQAVLLVMKGGAND